MHPGRLLILFLSLSASQAWAAAITNLSDEPKTFSYGELDGEKIITIPPGQTFRIPGTVTFRYGDRETRIEDDEEYAIWKDGAFGPQKRIRCNSSFGF